MNRSTHHDDEMARAGKGGLADRWVQRARADMHARFLEYTKPNSSTSVLDVGASADPALLASNYLEQFSSELNITAVGLGTAGAAWRQQYPGIPYVKASATDLPFPDASFDIVYSHAVIEHVGSEARQSQMIAEALRVARSTVWITTPYRWHPMEFHTLLPVAHWLPKKWHRWLLKAIKFDRFAEEEALNLLDKRSLIAATQQALLRESRLDAQVELHTTWFAGFPSNLLLLIRLSEHS